MIKGDYLAHIEANKEEKQKIVYIAGPYTAPTKEGIEENIQRAAEWAKSFWKRGYAVICPHMNSAHFSGICEEELFLQGYLRILEECDLIAILPGHHQSFGTLAEIDHARDLGIEVLFLLEDYDEE